MVHVHLLHHGAEPGVTLLGHRLQGCSTAQRPPIVDTGYDFPCTSWTPQCFADCVTVCTKQAAQPPEYAAKEERAADGTPRREQQNHRIRENSQFDGLRRVADHAFTAGRTSGRRALRTEAVSDARKGGANVSMPPKGSGSCTGVPAFDGSDVQSTYSRWS